MANYFNHAFAMWMNNLKAKLNWHQNAASVIQEQNAACEEVKLKLQEQLRTLQESFVFKWFSWLFPEAPRFGDCHAIASQDGFISRWLQRCPGIGGLWKAREELQGCEHGLRQMESEALRFNDQLKSTWFGGRLLSGFDVEHRNGFLHGNRPIYIGVAGALALITGIVFAVRKTANEDEGEGTPEMEAVISDNLNLLDGLELETDYLDGIIPVENPEEEKSKLEGQLNELRGVVDEIIAQKDEQEKLKTQKDTEYQNLLIECAEKDLQRKEQEKLMQNLQAENEKITKMQDEKTELLNQLRNEMEELKALKEKEIIEQKSDYQKLENEINKKDLQLKEQDKLNQNLQAENEKLTKMQDEKTELLNQLRNEMEELKALKEQEIIEKTSDYQKLENEVNKKDHQLKEQDKLNQNLQAENEKLTKMQDEKTELLNQLRNEMEELKALKEKEIIAKTSDYQKLENEINKKDHQLEEQDKLNQNLQAENEKITKMLDEKTELLNQMRNEMEELKALKEKEIMEKKSDYQKLENEINKKDLQLKEQDKLNQNLQAENEKLTKMQDEKTELLNQLRNEMEELKASKEQEIIEKTSDYQKLENEINKKDLQVKEQEKLLKTIRAENKEIQLINENENKRGNLLKEGLFSQMNNKFKEAVDIFTAALAIETEKDEETALLHVLRAEVTSATDNPPHLHIVLDCCKAIEKGVEGWKAYMLRGKHLLKLGLFDAALKDFEIVKVKKSETNFKIIDDTLALKKQWEDKGHYEVLGVEQTATKAEIMKAFKELSMMCHPDRHRDKPEFIQDAFEEKYKKIVNAKLILVDKQNRRDYDEELRRQCSQQEEPWEFGGFNPWGRDDRWTYDQEPPRNNHGQWTYDQEPPRNNHGQWTYDQEPPRNNHGQWTYDQEPPRNNHGQWTYDQEPPRKNHGRRNQDRQNNQGYGDQYFY
ncbi:flagellar attachment zone protein 1-like [Palaemon carinicauda]|uniref:flagellar attachment zone protein 1-like n=1 Tax=Palaemon carinicauda TaxID=392227 RepID=UPI0035B5FF94